MNTHTAFHARPTEVSGQAASPCLTLSVYGTRRVTSSRLLGSSSFFAPLTLSNHCLWSAKAVTEHTGASQKKARQCSSRSSSHTRFHHAVISRYV